MTEEEALSGNIRYHYGRLDLNRLTSAEGLTLPEEIDTLELDGLTSAEGLTLPEEIDTHLGLIKLTTIRGITRWPSKIGWDVTINPLLPQEEKEELEKRYPGQVEYTYQ